MIDWIKEIAAREDTKLKQNLNLSKVKVTTRPRLIQLAPAPRERLIPQRRLAFTLHCSHISSCALQVQIIPHDKATAGSQVFIHLFLNLKLLQVC